MTLNLDINRIYSSLQAEQICAKILRQLQAWRQKMAVTEAYVIEKEYHALTADRVRIPNILHHFRERRQIVPRKRCSTPARLKATKRTYRDTTLMLTGKF